MSQPAVTISGNTMSEWLWQVSQNQDRDAFADLFQAMAPRVKSYFFKLGCDDSQAEELAQQTMVQVWRKAHLYDREKAAASTWIFRIARNLRIDGLRKVKRYDYVDMDFDAVSDDSDNQEDVIGQEEQDAIMRRAIGTLPADQVDVVTLSFYDGMSHAEIADALDVPLGTVKSRMRLAFARLRKEVGDLV